MQKVLDRSESMAKEKKKGIKEQNYGKSNVLYFKEDLEKLKNKKRM